MKSQSKIRFFSSIVIPCILIVGISGCAYEQRDEGGTEGKLESFPLVLHSDRELPEELFKAMEGAADEWNDELGMELLRIEPRAEQAIPVSGRFWVLYEEPNSGKNVIARTERYLNQKNQLVYGRIYVSPELMCLDCQVNHKYVFLHEFGHLMGLKDREQGGSFSVMRPFYPHSVGISSSTMHRWPTLTPEYDLGIDAGELKKLHKF